jgi:hypothetical protein
VPVRDVSKTLSDMGEEVISPGAREDSAPPSLDLETDTVPVQNVSSSLSSSFDIDSAGGFASSLAVARKGLHWMAVRPPVSTLTSSLHLGRIPVEFYHTESEQWCRTQVPIHHVPHLPLGRLGGFEAIEILVLFPRLFHPSLQH